MLVCLSAHLKPNKRKEPFHTSVEASEKNRQRSICAHEQANGGVLQLTK